MAFPGQEGQKILIEDTASYNKTEALNHYIREGKAIPVVSAGVGVAVPVPLPVSLPVPVKVVVSVRDGLGVGRWVVVAVEVEEAVLVWSALGDGVSAMAQEWTAVISMGTRKAHHSYIFKSVFAKGPPVWCRILYFIC